MSVVSSIVGPIVGGGGGGGGGGIDTSDANAVAGEILSPKTAYVNGVKLTGTYTLANATASGDAAAYHLKTGKKAWVDGAELTGAGYFPAMMQFDGSTGYYSKSAITVSGNKVTLCLSFQNDGFTGNVIQYLAAIVGTTTARISLLLISSNHASLPNRLSKLQMDVQNSAGTSIAKLISNVTVLDNNRHTVLASFDGDTGSASFIIDGTNADDAVNPDRVTPVAGTLDAGASTLGIGANQLGNNKTDGRIGFVGYRDAYRTNWSDFMQSDGAPKNIESTLNTVWGAQPLFWNESGYMQDNKGSAGAMTANGTIVVAPASSWS